MTPLSSSSSASAHTRTAGTRPRPAARWRQAVVTLAALYPAVVLADVLVGPLVRELPRPIAILGSIVPVVVVMTYAAMPLAHRWLGGWMNSGRRSPPVVDADARCG